MRKKWMACGVCLALAACASYDGAELRPGASGDEIRSAMGEPGTIWGEADGGATWEYARGPQGLHTYMARLGSDGRLRAIRQVLNIETFATIRPGTTRREEVRRLLGPPARELYFALKDEQVWDYRYFDEASRYDYAFSVHFNPLGVVSGTEATPDDPRFFASGPDGLD